ncbi:unnamed protein product [Fusarium fujikuroi]|uniref:Uncharacterized protein n=1 Tax=Fusarium fujikuroi TaxID=5127 RepID=A0A9Q9RWU7_FUSFU|nr:unnamed protein product [Fusarium fujikuroi]VTT79715.1 unnamed protein product [Fusarium fujikuroi]
MVVAATINDATLETSLNVERHAKENAHEAKSKCKLLASALWKSTWIITTKGVNSKGQLVNSIKYMTCKSSKNSKQH